MKSFFEIKPEYTVDRFTDRGAPTANHNSFSRLVNMIPNKGECSTRLGIGELVHTPDTTGQLYDPTTDPECVMWLRMESNATMYDCEINGSSYLYAEGGAITADTSSYWEGSGSMWGNAYAGSGANMRKLTSDLPSGFAACDDEEGYIITFFLSLDWYPPEGESVQMFNKYGEPGGADINGAFYAQVRRSSGETNPYFAFVPYDRLGSSKENVFDTDINMFADWHIGMWVSKDLSLAGMRGYRISNGTTTSKTIGCAGTSYDRTAGRYLMIGPDRASQKFRGNLDDFIVLKGVAGMTQQQIEDKIDSIRIRLGYT